MEKCEVKLRVYVDRMSQPSRAVLIFCMVNKINFEEHLVNLAKGDHKQPKFKAGLVLNRVLAPALGLALNPQAASGAEKLLKSSLLKLETVWLPGNGRFLTGSYQLSIADLSLACEVMQLELLDRSDIDMLLGPHEKVRKWIEKVRKATEPYFEEVHDKVYKASMRFRSRKLQVYSNGTAVDSSRGVVSSKL